VQSLFKKQDAWERLSSAHDSLENEVRELKNRESVSISQLRQQSDHGGNGHRPVPWSPFLVKQTDFEQYQRAAERAAAENLQKVSTDLEKLNEVWVKHIGTIEQKRSEDGEALQQQISATAQRQDEAMSTSKKKLQESDQATKERLEKLETRLSKVGDDVLKDLKQQTSTTDGLLSYFPSIWGSQQEVKKTVEKSSSKMSHDVDAVKTDLEKLQKQMTSDVTSIRRDIMRELTEVRDAVDYQMDNIGKIGQVDIDRPSLEVPSDVEDKLQNLSAAVADIQEELKNVQEWRETSPPPIEAPDFNFDAKFLSIDSEIRALQSELNDVKESIEESAVFNLVPEVDRPGEERTVTDPEPTPERQDEPFTNQDTNVVHSTDATSPIAPAQNQEAQGAREPFFKDPKHPDDPRSRALTLGVEQDILDAIQRRRSTEDKKKLVNRMILKIHPDKGGTDEACHWFEEWKKGHFDWFLTVGS
jgi:hypothetical protein